MIAILFMVAAGGVIAVFVTMAVAIARKENEEREPASMHAPERERIAASLLYHVVAAGGGAPDDAMRAVRRGSGIAAPVTAGIDVASWADSYARKSTPQQRMGLLETAVQLVAAPGTAIPLRQYAALLDLSFGLGFQTDALARLRELYGFEYVDHAKDARPRHADRGGGGAPLFVREPRQQSELRRVMGVSETATRQEIIAAYRKLVAQHHPDKFHGSSHEAQSDAASRFIEITRAYEELLLAFRD
ncbi:MAG TPA: J domain-containing protein [Thermoanaerobaculia bacterium]|nr:J domain-containing protein [Thermoanaerobaculia bacterium]